MQNKPTTLCWFPWYPKDWITSDSVGRMTDDQIVAYVFLLNRQWLCESGRLPEDVEILSKYAMHDMSTEKMQCVLERFPVHPDGGRANVRLYDIYLEQQSKHQKRVDSANKRWGNSPSSDAKDNAMHNAKHMHSASGSDSGSDSKSSSGDNGSGKKRGKKSYSETEKKRIRVDSVLPIMTRVASWFGRQESTKWTMYEVDAWDNVKPTIEEVNDLELYYTFDHPSGADYRRRKLEQLLNNWQSEVDKARAFIGEMNRKQKEQETPFGA